MADYYPFGEIRIDQSFTPGVAADGTPTGTPTPTGYKNPYKFTGKELDTDIGLYYYGARYYNPTIGRFVSMDPWEGDLKDPQTLNKYSYVLNNTLKYIDPKGLWNEKNGTVEKGDTLSKITKTINKIYKTKYSIKDIAKLNNIKNANKISIGQIIIPNGIVPDISNKLVTLMKEHAKDWKINNPWYFKGKVKTGGDWDLKNTEDFNSKKYKLGFVFYGKRIRFDDPGNIHYGYVGAATWFGTTDKLLYYAGKNQQAGKNPNNPEWLETNARGYGDDPHDTEMIEYGISLQNGSGGGKGL